MEMRKLDEDENIYTMALSGKLDVEGESIIGDKFRQVTAENDKNFIVDMGNVTYLASLGIRLLFVGAKNLASVGKKLIVVNPQPMVEETLLNSGTVKLIPIAKTKEEAQSLL